MTEAEEIKMCLNCPYDECVDCVESGHKALEERALKKTIPYKEAVMLVENSTNKRKKFFHYYCLGHNDTEIGDLMGMSDASVRAMRKALTLGALPRESLIERKVYIERWINA